MILANSVKFNNPPYEGGQGDVSVSKHLQISPMALLPELFRRFIPQA